MNNILLTGRPGVGKTTAIRRLAELLAHHTIAGFYTAEIREGPRQGFEAITFSGGSCVLAHVGIRSRQRVGRYGVNVAEFERLVLPELARLCDVLLIDEIGKMECFSTPFVDAARALLDGPIPIIATVAVAGGGLIAEAKRRADAEIWEVTRDNRDDIPRALAAHVEKLGAR